MSGPALELAYGVQPPGIVYVTPDPAHPVEDTLTFAVANASGSAIEFVNPGRLTPRSPLPAYSDRGPNPLSRLYVWFPWGDAAGDLATAGNAASIVASSGSADWAASDRMSDPELGTYWILFPLSPSVFLDVNESITFDFSSIVSYLPQGKDKALTWLATEPRVSGYESTKTTVDVWKQLVTATLTASAESVIPGDEVTLAWETAGVESCSLQPGDFVDLPPAGSVVVTMPAERSVTWTLTGFPAAGSPLYAHATVEAATGWIDLGPNPAGSEYGCLLVRTASELVAVSYEDLSTWASPDGTSWGRRGDLQLFAGPPGWVAADGDQVLAAGPVVPPDEMTVYGSADGGASWNVVAQPAPWNFFTTGQSVTVFRGSLWVLGGGYEGTGVPRRQVFRSDGSGASWVQEPDAPWQPRAWQTNAAAAFDGSLWIAGGQTWVAGQGWVPALDLWLTDGQTWTEAPTPPWQDEQAVFTLVAGSDLLYALTYDANQTMHLWQMGRDQRWSAVPGQVPFGPEAQVGPGVAPRGRGFIAAADHTWVYSPPVP
jgi:hypothetical protein